MLETLLRFPSRLRHDALSTESMNNISPRLEDEKGGTKIVPHPTRDVLFLKHRRDFKGN